MFRKEYLALRSAAVYGKLIGVHSLSYIHSGVPRRLDKLASSFTWFAFEIIEAGNQSTGVGLPPACVIRPMLDKSFGRHGRICNGLIFAGPIK